MSTILYIGEVAGMQGGIERYCCQTASLLSQTGHQIIFSGNGQLGRLPDQFQKPFSQISTWEHLPKLAQQADLILIHKPIPAHLLENLPEKRSFFMAHDHQIYCRRHHYYTPWGRINCHRPYSPFRCWLCAMGRNTPPPLQEMRRFPAIVLSQFMADNLIRNGFARQKVQIIPPFITCPEKLPTKHFLPQGILRLLFLGQLIRGKGADLMLQTLRHVTVPICLTIAGDGKDRHWLENLAGKYDLSSKVTFVGWHPTPEKLLSETDLLLFPSRWQEPFGLVGLEALAYGVPVIGFQVGGVGEWLHDHQTGRAIPERNIALAAQAIDNCFHNPKQLRNWSQSSVQLAQQRFSPQRFIQNINSLLTGRAL